MNSKSRCEFSSFFRCEIGDEHAIDAGVLCFTRELLNSLLQQRIEVAEENDRNLSFSSRLGDCLQRLSDPKSITQRALGSPLDDRAIRHGIAERQAQLDHRRPGASEFDD